MKVTLNWLKQYVDFPWTPEELAEKLTMLGIEVEGIQKLTGEFDGVVVAQVITRDKHPNADKLSLCRDASSRFAPDAHRRSIETDERLFIVVTTTIKNIHRPQCGRAFTPRVCNYEIDPLAQWRSFAEQSTSEVIACSRGKDRQDRVRIDRRRMDIEIGVKFEETFCRLTERAVAADDTNALHARP